MHTTKKPKLAVDDDGFFDLEEAMLLHRIKSDWPKDVSWPSHPAQLVRLVRGEPRWFEDRGIEKQESL